MKRCTFALLLLALPAFVLATDVSGPVSGTWTLAGSLHTQPERNIP